VPNIRYHRYVGEPWDEIDLGELVGELSDFLLDSGFDHQGEPDEQDLDALRDAIFEAVVRRELLDEDELAKLLEDADTRERFLNELVERLRQEGFLGVRENEPPGEPVQTEPDNRPVKFELTEKGLDFLGFKAFKDLVSSLGRSSFGRHDSRDLSTGVEASGPSKPYEFGDTLNLDVPGTLLSALGRQGLTVPLEIDYADLLVRQSEYQSSCATVLMLDCSHSMVLYGEDRFTPAKRVGLALSHLIRTQYPGDSLRLVLFHDSAEEVPLSQLARVKVGPYHTNTREGLRLAQRLLARERKDVRQIVMITDGKPSALTAPDGSIYKNPFGLDTRIVALTLKEVANCRRQGVLVNTFMLARDPDLMAFVRQVTAIARGKAYFTAPHALGRFVLMDYLARKTRLVH
jgi:Ca-activated chloride channel family protein